MFAARVVSSSNNTNSTTIAGTAPQPTGDSCNACGFEASFCPDGMIPCERCRAVWYCSVDCLQWDWKRHPGGHKAHCVDRRDEEEKRRRKEELALFRQQEELLRSQKREEKNRRTSLDALDGKVGLKDRTKVWEEKNREISEKNLILSGHGSSNSVDHEHSMEFIVPTVQPTRKKVRLPNLFTKKKEASSPSRPTSNSRDDNNKQNAQTQKKSSIRTNLLKRKQQPIQNDANSEYIEKIIDSDEEFVEEEVEDTTEYDEEEILEEEEIVEEEIVDEEVEVADSDFAGVRARVEGLVEESSEYEELVVEDDEEEYEEEIIEDEDDGMATAKKRSLSSSSQSRTIDLTRSLASNPMFVMAVGVAVTAIVIAVVVRHRRRQ